MSHIPVPRFWKVLLACVGLLLTLGVPRKAHADEVPIPTVPTRWAEDHAGLLSSGVVRTLNARLEGYERRTGHQVVVYVGKTTGVTPIDDFAVRTFAAWKLGRKGMDDGLLLLIMAEDRKIDIEVGYGLEGSMPDATAKRIIEDVMVPRLRAGDADGAVTSGVDAVLAAIDGKGPPATGPPEPVRKGPRTADLVLFGLIGLVLLILFITNPALAMQFLFVMMSGRGGGFGGGGGGSSFGGGGGRSGGGGARGSW